MVITALLQLKKMIASPQCPQLIPGPLKLRYEHREIRPCRNTRHGRLLLRYFVVLEPKRDALAKLGNDLFAGSGRHPGKTGLDRLHTTADIYPNSIGDDGINGGENATNGHAIAHMGIGHERHMMKGAGKIRQVPSLGQGLGVEII
jgi:hypothetical protein